MEIKQLIVTAKKDMFLRREWAMVDQMVPWNPMHFKARIKHKKIIKLWKAIWFDNKTY